MDRLGYTKEVDWVERKIRVPDQDHQAHMDKYFRVAEMSAKRYNLRVRKFKSAKEIRKGGWGPENIRCSQQSIRPVVRLFRDERATGCPIRQHLPSARRHAARHARGRRRRTHHSHGGGYAFPLCTLCRKPRAACSLSVGIIWSRPCSSSIRIS